MIMKKTIVAATFTLLAAFGLKAQNDPAGTLSYALPQTVITLEVQAVREDFHAGPYAKYAQKYLGVNARTADGVSYEITDIRMVPAVEADQSRRFTVTPGKDAASFLSLTAQGLVSTGDGISGSTNWRFASAAKGDFSDKALTSNLTSEDATLYHSVKGESDYNKVAVRQQMVVAKSPEVMAKEAADMIFKLRQARVNIVVGDTDATYSGEAMASALEEIKRLEQEYMSMFIGYSEYSTQQMNYDVVPVKSNEKQMYIAFRLSDTEGLVPADNVSGKPYLLQLVPQPVSVAAGAAVKGPAAWYRVPAICTVKLMDGGNVLIQSRIPVYQLGIESSFPISTK